MAQPAENVPCAPVLVGPALSTAAHPTHPLPCTPQYDFFQYFMRAADADVERLLLALTDEPAVGVQAIVSSAADKPEQRLAQHALAGACVCVCERARTRFDTDVHTCATERVTRLVRGDEGLRSAERVTEVLFGKSEKHLRLQIEDVDALASHLPSVTLPPAQLLAMSLAELCVQVGLVESKGACRCCSYVHARASSFWRYSGVQAAREAGRAVREQCAGAGPRCASAAVRPARRRQRRSATIRAAALLVSAGSVYRIVCSGADGGAGSQVAAVGS